jgi:hypothetical protein
LREPRQDEKKSEQKLDRRHFLMGTALGVGALGLVRCSGDLSGPTTPPATTTFELEEVSLAELRDGMASGKWTAKQITEQYLARIEAMNTQGPALRAVLETNPDAIAIAEALDEERRQGAAIAMPRTLKIVSTADPLVGGRALSGVCSHS